MTSTRSWVAAVVGFAFYMVLFAAAFHGFGLNSRDAAGLVILLAAIGALFTVRAYRLGVFTWSRAK